MFSLDVSLAQLPAAVLLSMSEAYGGHSGFSRGRVAMVVVIILSPSLGGSYSHILRIMRVTRYRQGQNRRHYRGRIYPSSIMSHRLGVICLDDMSSSPREAMISNGMHSIHQVFAAEKASVRVMVRLRGGIRQASPIMQE